MKKPDYWGLVAMSICFPLVALVFLIAVLNDATESARATAEEWLERVGRVIFFPFYLVGLVCRKMGDYLERHP